MFPFNDLNLIILCSQELASDVPTLSLHLGIESTAFVKITPIFLRTHSQSTLVGSCSQSHVLNMGVAN